MAKKVKKAKLLFQGLSEEGVRSAVIKLLAPALTASKDAHVVRDGPSSEVTFGVDILIGYMDDEPRRDRKWFRVIVQEIE